MLDAQISPVFLATLSLLFGSYGVRELVLACRLEPFDGWIDKTVPGAGGLIVGALFALCSYRLIEGTAGLGGLIAWALH